MGRLRITNLKLRLYVTILTAVLFCSVGIFFGSSCTNPLAALVGTSEIFIIQGDIEISPDSIFSFGEVIAGAPKPVLTFKITNLGKTALSMPTGVLISGENASMFSVTTPPVKVLEPGADTSFSLAFNPSGTGGLKTAIVSIESNDKIINTFSFAVQGTFSGVTVYFLTSAHSPTNLSYIPIVISFSEQVESFTADDIDVDNCHVSSFQPRPNGIDYDVYITPESDGEITVYIPEGVANAAGTTHTNLASAEFSLIYDGTKPTGSISINGGASAINTHINVPLTLTGNDGGTGIKEMMISNTNSFDVFDGESFASSVIWSELVFVDDVATVYVQFIDYAGNKSVVLDDSIIFDDEPPPTPTEPVLAAEDYYEYDSGLDTYKTRQPTSLTFSGTAEENVHIEIYSNIDGLAGSGNSDTAGNWSVDAKLSYDSEGSIEHSISATATDAAGNESASTNWSGWTVTVEPPALTGIYISNSTNPEDAPVFPDKIWTTEPFQLYGYGEQDIYGTIDITQLVTWTSSSEAIAVVSDEGVVTGISGGTVIFTASIYNAEGNLLTVTTPGIIIVPAGSINIGLE